MEIYKFGEYWRIFAQEVNRLQEKLILELLSAKYGFGKFLWEFIGSNNAFINFRMLAIFKFI